VGNIYGSVMAAIIYNREKDESLEKKAKAIGDSLAQ
jgi:hypothetical protein